MNDIYRPRKRRHRAPAQPKPTVSPCPDFDTLLAFARVAGVVVEREPGDGTRFVAYINRTQIHVKRTDNPRSLRYWDSHMRRAAGFQP